MRQQTDKRNSGSKTDNIMLSKNPEKAMQEMMETIDELRGIYVEETEALENADTQTFFSLQDSKIKAAHKYEHGIAQMLQRKDEIRKVDPMLKHRLENMQNEFSDLTRKNIEALQRMQRCTERLSQTIRNAAKAAVQEQNTFSYGETGTLKGADGRSVSIGITETA